MIFVFLVLLIIGLLMVLSAAAASDEVRSDREMRRVATTAIFGVLALVVALILLVMSRVP